jgi:hypothetical protein
LFFFFLFFCSHLIIYLFSIIPLGIFNKLGIDDCTYEYPLVIIIIEATFYSLFYLIGFFFIICIKEIYFLKCQILITIPVFILLMIVMVVTSQDFYFVYVEFYFTFSFFFFFLILFF